MFKKYLCFLGVVVCLLSFLALPDNSFAKDDGYGAVISENPGKSIGVVGCGVAIAFFPPAAAVCALTVATGAVVDEIDD